MSEVYIDDDYDDYYNYRNILINFDADYVDSVGHHYLSVVTSMLIKSELAKLFEQ